MHDDERAQPTNKQTTPELSPRSIPKDSVMSKNEKDNKHAIYNPFAAVEDNSPESLYYASPQYPSAQKMDQSKDIKFGNVDWTIQKPDPTRPRATSHVQVVKTVKSISPRQSVSKPPFYRPSDSPSHSPPLASEPHKSPGLGIKLGQQNNWSPIDEKDHSGVTTPPLTYYTPYREENFRTHLDEKHPSWEPTQAPGSRYIPYRGDFEDVELARPKQPGGYPQVPPPYLVQPTPTAARSDKCIWFLYALILLIPLAVALGVFGGVYHWNFRDERCSISGGKWSEDSKTCQY